jgi:hypothetical protein
VSATSDDTHLKAWGGLKNETITLTENLDGSSHSETLKFSCCKDVTVEGNNHKVIGGKEDCLDIVRGCNYTFKNIDFIANGEQGATIKCAVSNVVFENVYFRGTTKNHLVTLGQYSDYNLEKQPPTQQIIFRNCKFDNPKKAIRLWYAKDVVLENTDAKITKTPSIIVWGYFTARRIFDRITTGKAGRSGSTVENKRNCCQ